MLPPPPGGTYNSHYYVGYLHQPPVSVPLYLRDFEEAPFELQSLGTAQHDLAAPLELEKVVQVPGGAWMNQVQGIRDLDPWGG